MLETSKTAALFAWKAIAKGCVGLHLVSNHIQELSEHIWGMHVLSEAMCLDIDT